MIKNSFIRLFLFAGLPIIIFLALFFSLLLGINEGLIPGLLVGLFVGGLISVILGFFYSKPIREAITEFRKDIKSQKAEQKSNKLIFLPHLILFLGALYTRYSGEILPAFVLTIVLSMTIFVLVCYFLEELKKPLIEEGVVVFITYTITQLIPFTITYFVFLFMFYGFNFKKISTLFK